MTNHQDGNPIVVSSRLREWWQPKAGNLLATIFLVVAWTGMPPQGMLWYFLPSIITIVGIGAFGHVVNDLCDIKSDRRAGKQNRMSSFSVSARAGIMSLFLIVALTPWFILPWDRNSLYLLGTEFLLLVLYAIPPIRFKERAFMGVLADGLYAHAVPTALAAYTYFLISDTLPDYYLLALLFIWQWILGIHGILIHQIEDYENDVTAAAHTFGVAVGQRRTIRFTQGLILPMELLLFLALLTYVSLHLGLWYSLLPLGMMSWRYVPLARSGTWHLYANSSNPLDLKITHMGYYKFLPFWNLFCCIFVHPLYALLFPVLLLLFGGIPFPHNKKKVWLHEALSHVVNWGIYAYRVRIRGENRRLALREYYDGQTFGKIPDNVTDLPTIALVNRNADKYTETFVRRHLRELPFNTLFYFGADSYFPAYGFIGRLLPWRGLWARLLNYHQRRMGLPHGFHRQKAWQRDLLHNKVQLVLAEFGTTGAAAMSACHDLDIPLVVIFHGYDAHNQATLAQNREDYSRLFKTASAIVGVSRDIVAKLQGLGTSTDKLHYLPCGINTALFRYSNHRDNPPVFLCVGRFAETKSPHLTIMAFHKVTQALPHARLVMVGSKDGLYETCLILVKSLGLEHQVEFKGVLPPEKVREEMRCTRVFVQHSLTTPINGDKEGTPVSVMEAMASGLPVVATRHAGIAEMITHEETGLLVEEYDVEGMAQQMIRLAQDDDLVERLGKNASKAIHEHPLIKHNIEELSRIIMDNIRD